MKSLLSLFLVIFLLQSISVRGQKISSEEIISKHSASVGTKERLAETNSITATGLINYNISRSVLAEPPGGGKEPKIPEKALLISEANKVFLGVKSNSSDYIFGNLFYDGEKTNLTYVDAPNRYTLKDFLGGNSDILSKGLFGGTLSKAWCLLHTDSDSRITLEGRKKINGRQTYVLGYVAKNSPESKSLPKLSIKLYFDAETFRHMRTEYIQLFNDTGFKIPGRHSRRIPITHKLIEDFSNYSVVNGLTLPHTYQITLLISNAEIFNESFVESLKIKYEYVLNFSEFHFNQKIDSSLFRIK